MFGFVFVRVLIYIFRCLNVVWRFSDRQVLAQMLIVTINKYTECQCCNLKLLFVRCVSNGVM